MKKGVRRAALSVAVLLGALLYLESSLLPIPGWWRAPEFWPHASGSVRWRLEASRLKLLGQLPELTWGQLAHYLVPRLERDSSSTGFVRSSGQVGEAPCPVLWHTPVGDLWGRAEDEKLLEFLIVEQLVDRIYENKTIQVQSGDTVVDVGGHLGVFTRFALTHGARQVVAFEPEPNNAACFERTFAEEIDRGAVVLIKAALWSRRDVLEFSAPEARNTGGGSVVHLDEETIQVPAVTLDDTVEELALTEVDFVKLDIEGAESHALTGARQTLRRFRPRMAVCTYHEIGEEEVVEQLVTAAQPQYRSESGRNHVYFY